MTITEDAQLVADTALATGAITTPLWVQHLETGLGWYVIIGGACLLTLRVIKTVYDIRNAHKKD